VAQTIAAAAVTSGVEKDVPTGVITYGVVVDMNVEATTLMPSAGATRSTCGPRVDFDQTFVVERGASAPTPSTPGSAAG